MDTISHIALQGMIGWFLLKRKNKDTLYLQNIKTKALFIAILFFTVLPDFDIFFGLHRAYTHSLTWPTIFLISGIIIQQKENSSIKPNKNSIIWISLLMISFFLYSHLLLDITGPYAMGLLYPFSDKQYELVISIIFNSFEGKIEDIEIGWRQITIQQQVQESNGIWAATVPMYPFYLLLFFIIFVLYDLIRPNKMVVDQ